jgi:hypothetical protein
VGEHDVGSDLDHRPGGRSHLFQRVHRGTDRDPVRDIDGRPLADHERPLIIALEKQQPAQRTVRILNDTGQNKLVADTAIPIVGEGNRPLGAMVILWETGDSHT